MRRMVIWSGLIFTVRLWRPFGIQPSVGKKAYDIVILQSFSLCSAVEILRKGSGSGRMRFLASKMGGN